MTSQDSTSEGCFVHYFFLSTILPFFIWNYRPPLFMSLSCALRFLFVSFSVVVRSGVIKTLCKIGGSIGSRSLVQLCKTLVLSKSVPRATLSSLGLAPFLPRRKHLFLVILHGVKVLLANVCNKAN